MVPIDHSLTYKGRALRNIPHRRRLRHLLRIADRELKGIDTAAVRYADFGCSNGYLTNVLTQRFHFESSYGFDNNLENLDIARDRYPNISFELFDLNILGRIPDKFDVIICPEVLEHVGNLGNALLNLLNSMKSKTSVLIVTVPVEIGARGLAKFLLKRFVYGYSLDELSGPSTLDYIGALLKGSRMSSFREPRAGWGTHFGFDHRDIDQILQRRAVNFTAVNNLTTRFYVIRR